MRKMLASVITVMILTALAVSVAAASVAVTVRAPAVLNVKLESVRVPATKVRLPAVRPLSSSRPAKGVINIAREKRSQSRMSGYFTATTAVR